MQKSRAFKGKNKENYTKVADQRSCLTLWRYTTNKNSVQISHETTKSSPLPYSSRSHVNATLQFGGKEASHGEKYTKGERPLPVPEEFFYLTADHISGRNQPVFLKPVSITQDCGCSFLFSVENVWAHRVSQVKQTFNHAIIKSYFFP